MKSVKKSRSLQSKDLLFISILLFILLISEIEGASSIGKTHDWHEDSAHD